MTSKTKRAKRRDYVVDAHRKDKIDLTKAIHRAIKAQLTKETP